MLLGAIGMAAGIGQWLMYRQGFTCLDSPWTLLIFLLLPLTFVLPNTIADAMPLGLTKVLARIGGFWFIFTYYSSLALPFFLLLWLAFLISGHGSGWPALAGWLGPAIFAVIAAAIGFGSWRARHPVQRHITVTTDKPLPRELTLAFASDLHLGAVIGKSVSRRLVQQMNAIEADLILFGGDLIDGNLELVLQDGSFQPLKGLRAPLGVIAVFGNHDYYGQDLDTEREALNECGIRTLRNQQLLIEDQLLLTGMDDYAYHFSEKIPKMPAPYFQLIIDHETWRIRQAAHAGCDLFLCGHTHAGQFWPNRYVTRRMYSLDYGTRKIGNLLAVVSSGYGAWGTLVRIGPPPEIVVIHLKPAQPKES